MAQAIDSTRSAYLACPLPVSLDFCMRLPNFFGKHGDEPSGPVYGGRSDPLFVEYQGHGMDHFLFAVSQATGNVSGLWEEVQEAGGGKVGLSAADRNAGIG